MAQKTSFIDQIHSLPTPSPVLQRICSIVGNKDASIDEVVEAIKLDPAIVGKVLRLANSAYMGMSRKISSLKNAVVLLGLKRIYSIVLVSNYITPFCRKEQHGFSLERFWRHSTILGLIAESIGRHLKRYGPIDEQEYFTGAVLHDIGKVALAVCDPQTLQRAFDTSRLHHIPFCKAETEDRAHTTVGAQLAHYWGFPAELTAVIGGHHDPLRCAEHAQFVSVIHVADCMAHGIGYSTFEGEDIPPIHDAALAAVRLPIERLKVIAETEIENQQRIEELYAIFGK